MFVVTDGELMFAGYCYKNGLFEPKFDQFLVLLMNEEDADNAVKVLSIDGKVYTKKLVSIG